VRDHAGAARVGHHRAAFEHVAELVDVAGPRVAAQLREGAVRDREGAGAERRQELFGERGDVLHALAQRGTRTDTTARRKHKSCRNAPPARG